MPIVFLLHHTAPAAGRKAQRRDLRNSNHIGRVEHNGL